MLPPDTTLLLQVLLTMLTLSGAPLKVGQIEQAVGLDVSLTVLLTQSVVIFRHRAYTVKAVAV